MSKSAFHLPPQGYHISEVIVVAGTGRDGVTKPEYLDYTTRGLDNPGCQLGLLVVTVVEYAGRGSYSPYLVEYYFLWLGNINEGVWYEATQMYGEPGLIWPTTASPHSNAVQTVGVFQGSHSPVSREFIWRVAGDAAEDALTQELTHKLREFLVKHAIKVA